MRCLTTVAIWLIALVLGGRLAAWRQADMPEDMDLVAQFLGDSRTVVSSRFIMTSDRYFHGGLQSNRDPDDRDPPDDPDDHRFLASREHGPECGHECGHDEHDDCDYFGAEVQGRYHGPGWYRKLSQAVRPSGHVHLTTRAEVAEVLPWFWAAAKLDPHNTQAYELGAFWLAFQVREPGKALTFIDQGIANNPNAFELYLAKAQILARSDPAGALDALEPAERHWLAARKLYENDELDARRRPPELLDMAEILVLQANSLRTLNRLGEAIDRFRRAIPFSQRSDDLRERIADLQRQQSAPPREE